MHLFELSLHELHELLKARKISARELTEDSIKRIEDVEQDVKAYITLTKESALQKADEIDAKLKEGASISYLAGIPAAVKDNICTEGIKTTCASKMLENFIPPYNATVVEKLSHEDVIVLGKLNMDEFAMGSSTENSRFFKTRNPWNLETVPGGSSGGAVAAVSADEAVFTLGSDTGGSIRQPASFCGVVGLKPTYGLVSRFGLIAYASSLDQIGPVTKNVRDNALVLNAIAGYDAKDSTSARVEKPDYTSFLTGEIKGMKIGIPKEYFAEGIQEDVKTAIENAIKTFMELGAVCEEVSLPHTEYALPAYYIIAPAEASSNLARYDGVRYGYRADNVEDVIDMFKLSRSEGFGSEVKRRIMLGTYVLSSGYYDAYYLKALKVRTLVKQDFDKAFEKFDILISPTSPSTAFKFDEKANDPLSMYLSDVCTIPINLAGIPAMSLPCGFSNGLPIGLQIMAKAFNEGEIYRAAYAFEQATDFHRAKPNLGR